MPPRVYGSSRDRILDAAERLLGAEGVGGVSVESVATAAGVSKGAFFHHFKTKDAMLLSMLDRMSKRVEAQITERAGEDPEPRGARLRAQVSLTFDEDTLALPRGLMVAMLQLVMTQPALARLAHDINIAAVARDVGEDIVEGRALAVQLALDGFGIAQSAGIPVTPRQRAALRDTLMALAQPEASARPRRKTATRTRRKTTPAPAKGKRR